MITGAIICRNNQDTILKAVSSFYGLCDEIVIVDTGSTDGTLDLLKGLKNIKFFEIQWEDDFSKARNYALDKCSGEWIVFLDSDEWIDAKGKVQIKSLLDKGADCWEVIQMSYVDDEIIMCPTIRIFKKGLKYDLPVHESVANSVRENKYKVGKSNVIFHHSGWQAEKTDKRKRNYDLIGIEHPLYDYYYGMIESGEEKEKKLLRTLKASHNKFLNAYVYNLLSEHYLNSGEIYKAIKCAEISLQIEKRQNLAYHLLQRIYLKIGLIDEVIYNLEKILERIDLVQCYVVNDRLFNKELTIQSIHELKDFRKETTNKLKGI